MGVDDHRQIGVGRGELVEGLALGGAVDHVDQVGATVGDHPLGLGPVGGGEGDRYAGLALPQAPQVDQITLDLPVVVAEKVGRVVVVADHMEAARGHRPVRAGAFGVGHGQAGRQHDHEAKGEPHDHPAGYGD